MENITSFLNRRIENILGKGILENVIVDSIIVPEWVYDRMSNKEGLILEAMVAFNPVPGVKHYSYRIDKQQGEGGPGRQRHIHIFYDGEELFAMNVDSTDHDGYHQVRIPDEITTFLNDKGFPVPPGNLIEFYQIPGGKQLVCEITNYDALNRSAQRVAAVLDNISIITIIEANVDAFQVKGPSSVIGKYTHVNQLDMVPQDVLCEVKRQLIELLNGTRKYRDEDLYICDGSLTAPHKLFVAWS